MKTKNLVVIALFVAIGGVLHLVVPSGGMKPDFSLLMLFFGILLFRERKSVLLLALGTGIVAGLTSNFPGGGLFPNIIDKFFTAFLFYGLVRLSRRQTSLVVNAILTAFGTLCSGIIFLLSAHFLIGLPAPFVVLFLQAVLPAMAVNTIATVVFYPIVAKIAVRSNLIEAV